MPDTSGLPTRTPCAVEPPRWAPVLALVLCALLCAAIVAAVHLALPGGVS